VKIEANPKRWGYTTSQTTDGGKGGMIRKRINKTFGTTNKKKKKKHAAARRQRSRATFSSGRKERMIGGT